MVKIVEMDEDVTLKSQLEEDVGPVIVLNKFTVKSEDVDQFLKVYLYQQYLYSLIKEIKNIIFYIHILSIQRYLTVEF